MKTKSKKVWTQGRWKKEADTWFSRFIRWRDKGKCYTCPYQANPKYMQCGHFVPRQYLATRYDETNCHTQCYACNMHYGGQPDVFALRLDKDYGAGTVARLNATRQLISKLDYPAIVAKYKALHEDQIS